MKIRTKIFLIMLLLVMVTGTAIIVVNHITTRNMTKKYIYDHLSTAAESRAKHVETFLKSEEEAIKQLSESIVIERLLLADRDDPDYSRKYDDVIWRLKGTAEINKYVCGVLVLDKNGTIVASSEKIDIGKDKSNDPYFIGGEKGVFIKDAYIPQDIKIPTITFSAPIFDKENTVFCGVVAIRVSMKGLYKITTDRVGLGENGEIFLVNKDDYMITPSRFLNDTFLKQNVEFVRGHPAACVFHCKTDHDHAVILIIKGYVQDHLALRREFNRISDEVGNYLSESPRISPQQRRDLRFYQAGHLQTFFICA